jgi:hypothetical protein
MKLDTAAMLSGSPGTIDGRAQAPSHWARLLLICLLALSLSLLSGYISHARPAKDPMNYKLYAHNQLKDWDQFICLVELYERESNWSPLARNGSHYGIPQGRSTYLAKVGYKKQIRWGLRYIEHRHRTPCLALQHFKAKGWH